MSFNLPASQATTFRKLGCPLSIFILIGVNQGKYSCKIVNFFLTSGAYSFLTVDRCTKKQMHFVFKKMSLKP